MAEFRFSAGNRKNRLKLASGGLIFILVFLLPILSAGGIKDNIACGECHTMHNSQNMSSMTGDGAEQALLANNCVGCHTGVNVDPGTSGYPYILDSSASGADYGGSGTGIGGNTLAGGNFYWVQFNDRKGHNVAGISDPDVELGTVPPGGSDIGGQLTCAGQYGCHGDRSTGNSDLDALRPRSHHVDDDPTLGTSVPNSYRFLEGVKGFEDADWEFTVNVTTGLEDHNQYKGVTDGGAAATDTISSFCAKCHGNFHTADTSSPFLRHPTDISLPTSGEHGAYTTYDPAVPVASTDITGPLSDISAADGEDRIVNCISCHRAHGSPYDSILRWDYKSWPNGGYNGCAVCHSYKN